MGQKMENPFKNGPVGMTALSGRPSGEKPDSPDPNKVLILRTEVNSK